MRDYWVVIRGNLSPWTTTTISPLTLEEAKRALNDHSRRSPAIFATILTSWQFRLLLAGEPGMKKILYGDDTFEKSTITTSISTLRLSDGSPNNVFVVNVRVDFDEYLCVEAGSPTCPIVVGTILDELVTTFPLVRKGNAFRPKPGEGVTVDAIFIRDWTNSVSAVALSFGIQLSDSKEADAFAALVAPKFEKLSHLLVDVVRRAIAAEIQRAKDLRISDQVEDHCAAIVAASKDRAKKDTDFYSGLYALEQKAHAAHISNLKRALVTPEEFDPKLANASAVIKQRVLKEMENHLDAEKKRHP